MSGISGKPSPKTPGNSDRTKVERKALKFFRKKIKPMVGQPAVCSKLVDMVFQRWQEQKPFFKQSPLLGWFWKKNLILVTGKIASITKEVEKTTGSDRTKVERSTSTRALEFFRTKIKPMVGQPAVCSKVVDVVFKRWQKQQRLFKTKSLGKFFRLRTFWKKNVAFIVGKIASITQEVEADLMEKRYIAEKVKEILRLEGSETELDLEDDRLYEVEVRASEASEVCEERVNAWMNEESREGLVTVSVTINAAKLGEEATSLGFAFEGDLSETVIIAVSAQERDLLKEYVQMGLVTGVERAMCCANPQKQATFGAHRPKMLGLIALNALTETV